MKTWILLVLMMAFVRLPGEAIPAGITTLHFNERSPLSEYEVMAKRYGWGKPAQDALYVIDKEEFEVYVPSSYDGTIPYGLMVYINNSPGGGAWAYKDLMDRHRMIWIGATNVPNERNVVPRWGLAIDAVWNVTKRMRIDEERIYVTGLSGGGRCASMVAPTFPEVFRGGIYMMGCNAPTLPGDKALKERSLQGRYALTTGEKDYNRDATKGLVETYKNLKMQNVDYFEQPGLGHEFLSAEWFEKALVWCDKPVIERANEIVAQAKKAEARKPYETAVAYRRVIKGSPIATEAIAAARERFDVLAPQVDGILLKEYAGYEKASADKLRAFAERVDGFPCAADVRARADQAGLAELDKITAKPGAKVADRIEGFLIAWRGFPCADEAAKRYEALAAEALAPVLAMDPDKRLPALEKFTRDWLDGPSRQQAMTQIYAALDALVESACQLPRSSPKRTGSLAAIIKQWPGTPAAAKAADALAADTAPAAK
jgi:predicted esterase